MIDCRFEGRNEASGERETEIEITAEGTDIGLQPRPPAETRNNEGAGPEDVRKESWRRPSLRA